MEQSWVAPPVSPPTFDPPPPMRLLPLLPMRGRIPQTMVIGMIATRFDMSAEDAEALQNYVIVMEMFW